MTEPNDTSAGAASAGSWMPQEAFDRLKAEYEERTGPLRAEITARIEEAREEGGLKENAGYHAAKDEQGKNEARIRALRELLENAHVGEPPADGDGSITEGTVVTIRFVGDDDTETFLLGHREANAGSDVQVFSTASPLGAAVLGAKPGDTVEYELPNGRRAGVEVVSAEPFTG